MIVFFSGPIERKDWCFCVVLFKGSFGCLCACKGSIRKPCKTNKQEKVLFTWEQSRSRLPWCAVTKDGYILSWNPQIKLNIHAIYAKNVSKGYLKKKKQHTYQYSEQQFQACNS